MIELLQLQHSRTPALLQLLRSNAYLTTTIVPTGRLLQRHSNRLYITTYSSNAKAALHEYIRKLNKDSKHGCLKKTVLNPYAGNYIL